MRTLTTICVCLLIISGVFLFGWKKGRQSVEPQMMYVVNEKILIDTVKEYEPIVVPELIIIEDTVYLEMMVSDTIQKVSLIKQTKTYQDSTYKAVVSGYNPNLDYIETYNKTIIRDIQARPQYWSISALVGTSFMKDNASLYGAIDVTYSRDKWDLSGQIGRDFHLGQNYMNIEVGYKIFNW